MDSVFAQYTRPLKGLKRCLDLGRAEFNGAASVATNLKEADTSKTRNYLIAGTALLALSGTAVAEPTPDGPTRNIDCHWWVASGTKSRLERT